MTSQGWKPYKQTAGTVFLAAGSVTTVGAMAEAGTVYGAIAAAGHIAGDMVTPGPPSTFSGAAISIGKDLWDIKLPLVD